MRGFILTALAALVWLAVPVAAEPQAERVCQPARQLPEHRRASFSKTPTPPPRFERCWYQHPKQEATVPASIGIGPGMEVTFGNRLRNHFRARNSTFLWRKRAFPASGHWGLGIRASHRQRVETRKMMRSMLWQYE
jgi:hypothetical protein